MAGWDRVVEGRQEAGPSGDHRTGNHPVTIMLNGEPYELARPMSVVELLETLSIDPRRVAVEHNLSIIKRHTFPDVVVDEGDRVEVVNFVGGG